MTPRKSTNISKYDMREFLQACLPEADRVYVNDDGWYILKRKQRGGGHNNTRCDPKARAALRDGLVEIVEDRRVRITDAGRGWLTVNS